MTQAEIERSHCHITIIRSTYLHYFYNMSLVFDEWSFQCTLVTISAEKTLTTYFKGNQFELSSRFFKKCVLPIIIYFAILQFSHFPQEAGVIRYCRFK